VGGVSAEHGRRDGKRERKSGNLEIDQACPPKGRRRAHEADDLCQQPNLHGLHRLKTVSEEGKNNGKEGDKNHGPRYSDRSNRDADAKRDREHPPELKPVS
jgi:hypothetical protein